jgi:hypothetical protein
MIAKDNQSSLKLRGKIFFKKKVEKYFVGIKNDTIFTLSN